MSSMSTYSSTILFSHFQMLSQKYYSDTSDSLQNIMEFLNTSQPFVNKIIFSFHFIFCKAFISLFLNEKTSYTHQLNYFIFLSCDCDRW